MPNQSLIIASLSTITAVALALATAVHAEDVPWPPEDDTSDSVSAAIKQPLPARFCLSADAATSAREAFDAALAEHFRDELPAHRMPLKTPTQTDGLLDRMIGEGRLSLLTLVKTDSTDVFFGVNEKGRVGVHFDATSLMVRE